MELKDFIAKTLSDITIGIGEGNDLIKSNNKSFAPGGIIEVYFDISIATDESNTLGALGKITVASLFSAGANAETKKIDSNLSRIKFSVNINYSTEKTTAKM
jgi:hypothetical protein